MRHAPPTRTFRIPAISTSPSCCPCSTAGCSSGGAGPHPVGARGVAVLVRDHRRGRRVHRRLERVAARGRRHPAHPVRPAARYRDGAPGRDRSRSRAGRGLDRRRPDVPEPRDPPPGRSAAGLGPGRRDPPAAAGTSRAARSMARTSTRRLAATSSGSPSRTSPRASAPSVRTSPASISICSRRARRASRTSRWRSSPTATR